MQPIFSTDEPHHLKTNEFPLGKYNTKLLWNYSSSRITSRCRGCLFTLHSVMLFLLQFYLSNHYIPMYHCLQSDKLQSVKCSPPQKEKGKISKIRPFQPPFTCQFSDCTEKLLNLQPLFTRPELHKLTTNLQSLLRPVCTVHIKDSMYQRAAEAPINK